MNWRPAATRGALLLMDSLWSYALVAFVVALLSDTAGPAFLSVAAVVFVSYGLSLLLQSSDLSLGVLRVWGTALSLIIFYAIVRVGFFGDWRFWDLGWSDALFNDTAATVRDNLGPIIGIPMLWGLWLRGILRGQQSLGWESALGTFGIGVIIVGVIAVLQAIAQTPANVGLVAIPYVAVGLVAVSLAHTGRAEGEQSRPFTATWLVAAGGGILLLALVALFFALLDVPAVTAASQSIAALIGQGLVRLAYYVIYPFALLSYLGVEAFRWVFYLVVGHPHPPPPQAAQQGGNDCISGLLSNGFSQADATRICSESSSSGHPPHWAEILIRVLIVTPLVALVVVTLALLFGRLRKRIGPAVAVRESAYSEGRLGSDLAGLVGSILNRFRPRAPSAQLDAIRRLYFDVVAAGETRGVVRRPSETPLELSPRLDDRFAAATPGRITSVFLDARYGARPPPADDVSRLKQEWEELTSQA